MCVCVCVSSKTDCFVASQLFSVDTRARRLKLRLKPTQLYVRLIILPLSPKAIYVSSGIILPYLLTFVCLHADSLLEISFSNKLEVI